MTPTHLLQVDGLRVPVDIKAERTIFGRPEVLVSPIGGEGETWVSRARLISPTVTGTMCGGLNLHA